MIEIINQLEKLAELRDKGVLSEEEFQQQKAKILNKADHKNDTKSTQSVIEELADFQPMNAPQQINRKNKLSGLRKFNIIAGCIIGFIIVISVMSGSKTDPSPMNTDSNEIRNSSAAMSTSVQTDNQSSEKSQDVEQQQASNSISGNNDSENAEVVVVKMNKLISDYEANEIAADNKYKNKRLIITGRVSKISVSLGDGYINFGDELGNSLGARFTKNDYSNYLSKLNIGEPIVLNCLCAGVVLIDPYLKDCKPG